MTSIYLSVRIYRILRYGALIPLLSAWLTLPEDGRDTDGEAFTNRKLLSVRPLHPANYTIKIMSGMKDEKLQGLSDVGIRIEKQ